MRPTRAVRAILAVSCLMAAVASSTARAASFSWSAPISLNGTDPRVSTTALACPAVSQCTAVTVTGQEVTFNPMIPSAVSPVTINSGARLYAVACPATTECVAVGDSRGHELTFDPSAPEAPTPIAIDTTGIDGLACPTVTQCTGVDGGAQREVTFNPTAAGTPALVSLNMPATHVVCPSPSQCTAVYGTGEVTFNPISPGTPMPAAIDTDGSISGVACPSLSQCTIVDGAGIEETFDPTSPGSPQRNTIDGGVALDAVDCPSTTECIAVDAAGRAFIGDPTTTGLWVVESIHAANSLGSVSCPSTGECVTTDTVDNAFLGVAGPVSTSPPSITGSPVQGQALTEVHAAWSPAPTAYSYQWERCDAAGSACAAVYGSTAQAYTLTTADVGATIRVQETTADADGPSLPATSAPTAVVTAPSSGGGGGSPPPSPPPPGTMPTVTGYRLTNNPFVVTGSRTPLTATASADRHPKGTTFKYTLSEAATVKIAVSQRLPGRRRGRACVPPSAKLRHARMCTRTVARGVLIRASHQGLNSVRFSGRIGATPLKPGQYEATLTATDANNHSSRPQTRTFRVVCR